MNTPPWTGERVVTPELAAHLIDTQFPELAPARLEFLAEGWDNVVYRVNAAYVFRFPRREVAAPLIEAELRLLPHLGPRLPLPVPVPLFSGQPSEPFPWTFAGYPFLPGITASSVGLSPADRHALAGPLGQFLAALHRIPAEEAEAWGAGPDPLHRMEFNERLPRARARLDELHQQGLLADPDRFQPILDDWPHGYRPRTDILTHGDLYARQLLVDDEHRLCAVIDWGDIHLGDSAADLAAAWILLPPTALEEFRQAYGPIDPPTWRAARLRGLWHTLNVVAYAHAIRDPTLRREAQTALAHLRES